MNRRVLLAAPRGCCAGVDRAIATVEKALELYGPPVYVRHEAIRPTHVLKTPEAKGRYTSRRTHPRPFTSSGQSRRANAYVAARRLSRAHTRSCSAVPLLFLSAVR
ncbi:hypothetical protein AB0J38_13410 [Streptomyces sp. NPDC050095]|uniref:hypothetical protein n=1 Tax=unclassified Streptomyces TaxID=2593676 RepID=UPI00341D5366